MQRLAFLNSKTEEIVKIQANWRAKKMAKAYRGLCKFLSRAEGCIIGFSCANPTPASLQNADVKVLQNFLHLMDDSDEDFEEELGKHRPPLTHFASTTES